ncbi:hypothetical protein LQ948_01040 [Jiella sp. MQZ9-1]|uniref:DUF937 domain-containing protein n=1 Tax=Jiella flava TaxID=2816857 RepID=A0A939JVC9_9HYPH|nr:hypothetical protein [Jiella flava]MBO0661146.1 hypothetical protein [Jiella flava]MCD2469792.1 hypothetical protein [Jiella flava]
MTDFFDWLTASDSGIGADRLADAFNLSQQEMRKTTSALAPAFALALQRAMIVPGAWATICRGYKPFMDDETSNFAHGTTHSPVARDLANALFGSQDIVSAIARHVSVASSVAPDTVEEMIRNISVMTIGTMLRMMMTNLTRSQPKQLTGGDYPGAVAEMLRRSANAIEALGRPSDAGPQSRAEISQIPGSDYLNRLFKNALTGSVPWLPPEAGKTPDERAAMPFPPYAALMEEFVRGFQQGSDDDATAAEATAAKRDATAGRQRGSETASAATTPTDLGDAALTFQKDYARRMLEILAPYATNWDGKTDDDRQSD